MKKIKRILSLLLVFCMVFSTSLKVLAETDNPGGGTTQNQPFSSNTGGSTYFRIPALVTLNDGTLVASADARWSGSGDAGGIDTIVSRSTDGGNAWSYSFANYLGDNDMQFNTNCATFIDPSMATDGSNTIYMLVDLFVAGYAINTAPKLPLTGLGFNNQGKLIVRESSTDSSTYSNYSYYVGDYGDNGYALIYDSTNTAVDGYKVDRWFNLYQNDTKISNLFYADGAYQAYPTTYLYLTKSTDGGVTWGAPTLLNVKNDGEMFYGVGPGSALVTSTGRIIFACYKYPDEYTSVIYSDDNGVTWTRSANMSANSSEATMAEVGGRIYMFTRHGGYYVSEDNGTNWSEQKSMGISYNTGCQLSAIKYSQKIDGKDAIILSAPASTSSRSTGTLFVALINSDGTLDWKYSYQVTDGSYAYSSMSEMEDGNIALLYESGGAYIYFNKYNMENMFPDAVIGNERTVNLCLGQDYVINVETVDAVIDTTNLDIGIAEVSGVETEGTDYTVTIHGNGIGTTSVVVDGITYNIKVTQYQEIDIELQIGETYKVQLESASDNIDRAEFNTDIASISDVVTTSAGYNKVTSITPGKQYLITRNGKIVTQTETNSNDWNIDSLSMVAGTVSGTQITGDNLENYLFTIQETTDGYTIQATNNEYITIASATSGNSAVTLETDPAFLRISPNGDSGTFLIQNSDGTRGLNDFGGKGTTAAGWSTSSDWTLYEYDSEDISTVIITGNKLGNTSVVIGQTKYTIIVHGDVENVSLYEEDSITYIDVSGDYSTDDTGVDETIATVDVTPIQVAAGRLGTDANYTGTPINLADCLYTFTASGNGYIVSSSTSDGTTVYLDPMGNDYAGYPFATSSKIITLSTGNAADSFYLYGNGRFLHFYRNGNNYFNRVGATSGFEEACSFLIYTLDETGIGSTEIPGYKQVTSVNDIKNEGQYLIVAQYNGSYYVLHPSTDTTSKYSHVAKVDGTVTGSKITITGISDGETKAAVGNTEYMIDVTGLVYIDVELIEGRCHNFYIPENTLRITPDANIVSVESIVGNNERYEEASGLPEAGKSYLIVAREGNHIVTSAADTQHGTGLAMIGVTNTGGVIKGNLDEYLWEVTKLDSRYQFKNNNNYISIVGGANVVPSDTMTSVDVQSYNGGYALGNSGQYLNDYAGAHTTASAYGSLDNGSTWHFYEYKNDGYTITLKGVQASNESTTLRSGNLIYNITVRGETSEDLKPDGIIGGTQTAYVNNNNFAEAGTDKTVRRVVTSVGVSYDLNLGAESAAIVEAGGSVEWVSADTSIAAVDMNGTVTGISALPPADNGFGAETTVTATVRDNTGKVVAIHEIQVVVMEGTGSNSGRLVSLYISEIKDTRVYVSINASTTMPEIFEGDVIYVRTPLNQYAYIDFFGSPDGGYALTRMSSTNSNSQYMPLKDDTGNAVVNDDTTDTNGNKVYFYNMDRAAGSNQRTYLSNDGADGDALIAAMVEAAVADPYNCDGGMGFSRPTGNNGGIGSDLTFRSEKLPTVNKTVEGILPASGLQADYRSYTEGMTASTGDVIFFKIEVQTYAAEDGITYTGVTLSDKMDDTAQNSAEYYSGAQSAVKNDDGNADFILDITEAIESGYILDENDNTIVTGMNDATYTYYVTYEIATEDLNKELINHVSLDYTYKSGYSTGAYKSSASSEARISVTPFNPQNIIVDFGLPVVLDYSQDDQLSQEGCALANVSEDNALQTIYGTVTVTDNVVTYIPNKVLKGVDEVTLVDEKNAAHTFKVYPATTVFYEESFAHVNEYFVSEGTGTAGSQTTSYVNLDTGSGAYYGYDDAYKDQSAASNGTQIVNYDEETQTYKAGATAEFEFTGTGVEVYANCNADTGYVMIQIRDAEGNLKKGAVVNTALIPGEYDKDGLTDVTEEYNVPIFSLKEGLEHGDYTVKITTLKKDNEAKAVRLDGFRVYGTAKNADEENTTNLHKKIYSLDEESTPRFIEMRDLILSAVNVSNYIQESQYASEIGKGIYEQIYGNAGSEMAAGAVIIDSVKEENDSSAITEEDIKDILDNGPKNEFYLYPGQALAFSLKDSITGAQLGMKALNGGVTYTVNGNEKTLSSSTDMFYKLNVTETEKIFTVKNSGNSGILVITGLKWFDNAVDSTTTPLTAMTEQDLKIALVSIGFMSDVGDNDGNEEEILEPGDSSGNEEGTGVTDDNDEKENDTDEYENTKEPDDSSDVILPFIDVLNSEWYYDCVSYVYDRSLMTGLTDDTFGAGNSIVRAQFAVILHRIEGEPLVKQALEFMDVENNAWYTGSVRWANASGIVFGYTDTKLFGTNDPITREQMAVMMYRYAEYKEYDVSATADMSTFEDGEQVSAFAKKAMQWAVGTGIISGKDNGTRLDPQGNASRAECAAIIMRFDRKYNKTE